MTFAKGTIVRPANNGEDARGILKWKKLTGVVVDSWEDCGEERVQVRWHQKAPYPTCLPAYFLSIIN